MTTASDLARAFWVAEPGRGEIRTERLHAPAANEALVRSAFSGVSRGTETLVFKGRVPRSEHERMRAPFQAGDFPSPVKYGYCNVGIVEQGPANLIGRHVFCLHPHQTRYVVPVAALHALPDDVPPARGVLAANLETAINALWDAAPRVGDRVAVIGAGTVGCLAAWLARRIVGTEVELVDIDERKAAAAHALGIAFRTPAAAHTDADVVVHASGSAAGLATGLALAGFEATVVELSWYGDEAPAVPRGAALHIRRFKV
jgi:threonine dehydrogenase-like Zn-dependent dehydrogenase